MNSSNTVKLISLDRAQLWTRLRDIAATIRTAHPEVEELRVFGSLARGDYTGTSDVDMLIVLRETAENDPHRRILTFLRYFDLDRGVDILVLTRAELDQQLAANNLFLKRVWKESIAL